MPRNVNFEKYYDKFKERYNELSEKGVELYEMPSKIEFIQEYKNLQEERRIGVIYGEFKSSNVLRTLLETYKKGAKSYRQVQTSKKIAYNIINSGVILDQDDLNYLEMLQTGAGTRYMRKYGNSRLFEIVRDVSLELESTMTDYLDRERESYYMVFGS